MQPYLTERVAHYLPQIQQFMNEEAPPLEEVLRQEGFAALLPVLAQKRQRVKELGLWTPHLPVELGGLGLTLMEFGHISEARLIPLDELRARLEEIPRDRPVVTICQSGKRSAMAAEILLKAGFPEVANVAGGMIQWSRLALPFREGI